MFTAASALVLAVSLLTASPPPAPTPAPIAPAVTSAEDRAWADERPNRGGAGRYLDSNVRSVWEDVPQWIREFGHCVRFHESIHSGHYDAHNGSSSAAGAYQFLDGTWQGNAKWAKHKGKYVARQYAAANHAPAWVQDVVFIHSVERGGMSNWNGTHCGYGT